MPQLTAGGIVFELAHHAVIVENFQIVHVAAFFEFEFRLQQLSVPIATLVFGDDGAQRQNFSGAVQTADFVVIGTGGYASAPAVLGGRFAHRPTVLIEPNAEAGLANRWASRFADAAAVAYEATAAKLKCLSWVTGVPVRAAFFEIAPLRTDGKARLLVLGGSQGSLRINRLMAEVLTPCLLYTSPSPRD